jgi:hypothetical protein
MSTKKNNPETNPSAALTQAAADLAACAAEIENVLGPEAAAALLDKRRSVRMRKGGERVVGVIGGLVKIYGLDSKGLHSDTMVEAMSTASELAPIEATLTRLLARVSNARFQAHSTAYDTMLQFYALLQRRALNDGQVAESIAPIEEFFSYRHNAVLANKPTKAQTKANAKLAHAQKLVARARPRVGVIEAEYDQAHAAPAPQPVAVAPAPVATPVVAPSANVPAASVSTRSPSTSTSTSNGSSNGTSNGWNGTPVPALANGQNQ